MPSAYSMGLSDIEIAGRARKIRQMIIQMVHSANCGHPGGPLGLADIFSVLYFDVMHHKPQIPLWADRDRLILSNGHVSAVRYATMKLAGYLKDVDIKTFRKFGSPLQGHPSTRYLPEVENSGGSLGQGLSVALGLALGARVQRKSYRVFACLSDGECGEGMIWEAATAAVHYKAPLIAFIDDNGIQIDGPTKKVCDLGDLGEKFSSFGWDTLRVDGHSVPAIREAFRRALAKLDQDSENGPIMIVFRTVLGKGVSFMENNHKWHGVAPNAEQAAQALRELKGDKK